MVKNVHVLPMCLYTHKTSDGTQFLKFKDANDLLREVVEDQVVGHPVESRIQVPRLPEISGNEFF